MMGSHPPGKDCAGGLLRGGNAVGVHQEQKTWLPFSSPEEVRRSKSWRAHFNSLLQHSLTQMLHSKSSKQFKHQSYLSASTPTKTAEAGSRCPLPLQTWFLPIGYDCAGMTWREVVEEPSQTLTSAQATGRHSTAKVQCATSRWQHKSWASAGHVQSIQLWQQQVLKHLRQQ